MSDSLWPGLVSWVVLYCSDYFLPPLRSGFTRLEFGTSWSLEGSYELTPYFQKDVDCLRSVSPRFVLALIGTVERRPDLVSQKRAPVAGRLLVPLGHARPRGVCRCADPSLPVPLPNGSRLGPKPFAGH